MKLSLALLVAPMAMAEALSDAGGVEAGVPADLQRWQLPWLQQEALRTGRAAETPFYVDGDEISALAEGVDAFFADGGRVESVDGKSFVGVGLKLDGEAVDTLSWAAYDARGQAIARGPVEITWSEGVAHVGRIRLPQPASRVELDRGKARLSFLQVEPLSELPAVGQRLARDLPMEYETAVRAPLPPGVISRAQWGARATGTCGSAHSPRFLTIHHTATPNNDSITPAARMRQMQAYHIDNNGFCDFGYHYTVGIDARVYEGRSPDRTGAHVADHNTNNVGISVVGTFVNFNPREAQLNALTDISRWVANRYGIPRTRSAVLGHNEWSGHTTNSCPGLIRPWLPTLVQRLNGTTPPPPPPPSTVLDSFEASLGRFGSAPTLSGSTVGISTSSLAQRSNLQAQAGQWSLQLRLVDNPSTSANWFVRLLSGGGTPANNASLQKAGGRLGAWFYTGATGVSVRYLVDDSDGTEISVARSLPANTWTFHEVRLDDSAQWDAWAGGNGIITAATATLDAIVVERAQTSFDVVVYVDNVSFRVQ